MDVQVLVERFHALRLRREQTSWPLCLVASRIVGQYERGVTLELADREGISVSQIEHLAHAGSAYRALRKYISPYIRRELSISHFAAAWEAFRLKDMPQNAKHAAEALVLAVDPPDGRTKWTSADVRAYAHEILGVRKVENPMRHINALYSWCEANMAIDDERREDVFETLGHLRYIVAEIYRSVSNE